MLLRAKGGKGLGVGCGEGGGEYGCITGRGRRDGSRPAGCEIVVRVARHGCYAVTRTAPGTAPAALRIEGDGSAGPFVLGRLELEVPQGDRADEACPVPLDVDQSRAGARDVCPNTAGRPHGRDRPAGSRLGDAVGIHHARCRVRAEDDAESSHHDGPLQDATLAEADEAARLAEDDVVEQLDAEELPGGGEPAREADVLG